MSEGPARVKVMVVEDDPDVSKAINRKLGGDGHDVELTDDPRPVLERLAQGEDEMWDVVVLDVGLPGMSGIDVLHEFRKAGSLSSIIMLTGDSSAATATTCMRAGAFYYLTKPFRPFELSAMIESAARYTRLRRELTRTKRDGESGPLLVGGSAAIRKLRAALDRLAGQDVSILIQGESGTGKELVARTLHDHGMRRAKRFVPLNCGAIPETLIDSELFGHIKGAFTGATVDRSGVFVEADGGTLFLDEIGDMPVAVQARLLRVLQEGEVRPVGGSTERTVDVRVIAASNVDLSRAVEQGRFRQDLFYRLNVVVLVVPPLRERLDDLPLLAAHFLRKHGGTHPPTLSGQALEAMAAYGWPGNVRELENAVLHALALHHGGDQIVAESLPAAIHKGGAPTTRASKPSSGSIELPNGDLPPLTDAKRKASSDFERRYLVLAMERAKGSVSEAARLAGLDRTNFRRLLQRHGIDAAEYK